MDAPRRIVVLDDDARVRQLIQSALRLPEFEVFPFADGRDALQKLHDIRPDLILSDVWMPEVDGRVFLQVVKRSPQLRGVPFVFLTAVAGQATIDSALQGGADGFLMKPFPVQMLREKVRTLLGMPADGAAAPIPLRLEPPPSIPTPPPAAALATETLRLPAPEPASMHPGSTLPAIPIDFLEDEPEEAGIRLPEVENLAHEIEGKFTMARVADRRIPVLTEADNRPVFTITTLMTSDGRPIRKIETTWQHPLERREDLASARLEVRLQHEQALASLEKLAHALTPRRVVWDPSSRLVDGKLLCWAITAVVEDARYRVGSAAAHDILALTYDRLRGSEDALRAFRPTIDGQVVLNESGAGVVRQSAVVAAAEWAVAFVTTAPRVSGENHAETVRRATSARSAQLERVGFSAAVTGALQRVGRPSDTRTSADRSRR